jgi:hypothetical protein
VSAQTYAQPHGNLLFHWERPRRRKLAIAGFILASLGLHAVCFYLFQVIYPPAIALLPPPARVSVIAPTSDEARSFLEWLDAEDPALASQTQRPANAPEYQLPKVAHVPSYLTMPPQLKELPPQKPQPNIVSAMPPGPVPMTSPTNPPARVGAPSTLRFSEELDGRAFASPPLKFHASSRAAPESGLFRIAVDDRGIVRFVFLEQSSGDAALDEQAQSDLARVRFAAEKTLPSGSPNEKLTWATATIEFGNDIALPSAEAAP